MARLISLNVGLPRDVEWNGRIVHTGIRADRNPSEMRPGHPGRREGQQRNREEVGEVDPDQARCRYLGEPQDVMMVDPDDRDEEVADDVA